MCITQNIFFECGCLEDTKYTMCDKAMTELGHITQIATPIFKTHPCAPCFTKGLEEKAKQTREQKQKQNKSGDRMDQS